MADITIDGLTFEPFITRDEIAVQVRRVAKEIHEALAEDESPLFVGVLTGAFIFAADLYRECDLPNSEIAFIRVKSYEGMQTTGKVTEVIGLTEDITNRTVVLIEDIVDTGITINKVKQQLQALHPKRVLTATLLYKPESLREGTPPEFSAFSIPSNFIIGYGLDLDGKVRNLPDIYVLKK